MVGAGIGKHNSTTANSFNAISIKTSAMELHIKFAIVLCFTTIFAHAQKYPPPLVNMGDTAPPLHVHWLKGTPVNNFEKGKVYVVEFWATWCRPCRAEMPHLSAIARKYKDSVTVLGIDIYDTMIPLSKIRTFVDSMGQQMDYNVAVADGNYMQNDWLNATNQIYMGIPTVFILNRDRRIAWMGHPCDDFEDALSKIINNSWDINASLVNRNLKFCLRNMENSLIEVLRFAPNGNYRSDIWKRDSALLLVNKMAKVEPLIKFTPLIAYYIFSVLIKTNTKKAYEYGKKVISTTTYDEPATYSIRDVIEDELSKKAKLPVEIYQLGIDALQVEIDNKLLCYPEILHTHRLYFTMAKWNWRIGNKSKAIEAVTKGIEVLKIEKDFSEKDLAAFNNLLKQFN